MVKIFVTGATGYIGGSVAERLVRDGHAVSGLVRNPAGALELERRSIRPVLGTLDAARLNVRSVVIRPTMIHGEGRGARKESFQVPVLIENAKANGIGLHVGRGENIWSHVHIDDVVELYVLALAKAPAGALYYAENGENALKDTAAAISRMLGFGGRTREWSPQDAEAAIGFKAHGSFGSNSRVRGKRSRAELGWQPKGVSLLEDIEHGWYRRVHRS